MNQKVLIGLTIILGFIYICFIPAEPVAVKLSFKVIPMLLIIWLASLQQVPVNTRYKNWLLLGLLFCMIGDATLQWFLIGLSSFLIGHICYIVAFIKLKKKAIAKPAAILLLLYGVFMVVWITGTVFKSGDIVLGIAVIAYIAVILTMGWTAIQTGSKLATIGALSFIFSDSILSINMFITEVPFSHALIMVSYYGAQLLFAISIPYYSVIRKKVLE
ncbi:lysoplasmalogenase [Viridibacillus sp. YIM B01967]|uniref:Lysoplasmalogenase n=1 Tax=Viridibacillus soli TaxID=2798301 RepID=A0ABS1H8A6_9BACL|nr:lysoplasmalogenase [Viridibacillus soli]MBK3495539.1 lysoplasmalogenase [Viridibacillus soli]